MDAPQRVADIRILPAEPKGSCVLSVHADGGRADYFLTPQGLKLLAFEVIEAMGLPGANSG